MAAPAGRIGAGDKVAVCSGPKFPKTGTAGSTLSEFGQRIYYMIHLGGGCVTPLQPHTIGEQYFRPVERTKMKILLARLGGSCAGVESQKLAAEAETFHRPCRDDSTDQGLSSAGYISHSWAFLSDSNIE